MATCNQLTPLSFNGSSVLCCTMIILCYTMTTGKIWEFKEGWENVSN